MDVTEPHQRILANQIFQNLCGVANFWNTVKTSVLQFGGWKPSLSIERELCFKIRVHFSPYVHLFVMEMVVKYTLSSFFQSLLFWVKIVHMNTLLPTEHWTLTQLPLIWEDLSHEPWACTFLLSMESMCSSCIYEGMFSAALYMSQMFSVVHTNEWIDDVLAFGIWTLRTYKSTPLFFVCIGMCYLIRIALLDLTKIHPLH